MTEVQEADTNVQTEASQRVPAKKPRVAARARHVPPSKSKTPKTATRGKKANKSARSAKPAKKATNARRGSKADKVIQLLKRPGGATGADLMKATGWQAHSVRGFISGVLGRRMGLKIRSEVNEGQRRYSLRG